MATGTATTVSSAKAGDAVGPPLLILGLGYASVAVGLVLVSAEGVGAHLVGYVTGSLLPILVVGIVRQSDLDRRRSPRYQPRSILRPAMGVLVLAALVVAALHVWPIATEWAS